MENQSRYRPDTVQAILKRAMELDEERGNTISLPDLQDIAAELGISRASVDQALLDIGPSAETRALQKITMRERWRSIPKFLLAMGAGSILASSVRVLQGMGSTGFVAVAALAGMLGGSAILAMRSKGVAKHEKFQFANLALWAGFMVPFLVVGGRSVGYMIEGLAPYAALTGVAGSLGIVTREFVARFGGGPDSPKATFGKRFLRAVHAAARAWKGNNVLRQRIS